MSTQAGRFQFRPYYANFVGEQEVQRGIALPRTCHCWTYLLSHPTA